MTIATHHKSGFTIVELVIVIAVIAILAAVLVPTFTSTIRKAEEARYMQEAKAVLDSVIVEEAAYNPGLYTNIRYFLVCNDENGVRKYLYSVGDGMMETTDEAIPTEFERKYVGVGESSENIIVISDISETWCCYKLVN